MGLSVEFRRFVGKQVSFWRQDRLMSLEDLAEQTGVSDTTCFRVEKGYPVSEASLMRVVESCGMTISRLSDVYQTHRQLPLNMPERS